MAHATQSQSSGAASSFPQPTTSDIVKFPWRRESTQEIAVIGVNKEAKAGEFILQNLFLEFCRVTERRIEIVLAEPLEKPLSKSLQRGEDPQFDQILNALGNVAEHCLPSILKTLFSWYQRQMKEDSPLLDTRQRHRSKGSKDYLCERRDLALEFVYCLVLIEVLSKLSYHPGHEDLVGYIIDQCFRHFKYRDGLQTNPNASNINIIADLYAEVIGVLANSRFLAVRKKFMGELKELKLRDQTPYTAQSIISLLMGLKFFRVKMHPIEEFELCVQLLLELGHYFLEVKDRDIKHALAGLFVEILLPVAATVKNEVNIPVLKKLAEDLYSFTVDMATKRKHTLHLFPLITCLLCVSQKQFFLNNWHYFLSMCLSQLKNRDVKMSRVALESLYRLLWVYMVRIKCESNTATQSRLQSIVNSLFPKGSKLVTPKDMPLNIFVKIIQFIAKERLDFAVKEIIFDLLCVGRNKNVLTPERMSIGLRAFLVIADSLQQKDGDPPMPQSTSSLPSGSTVRVKKTFLNKMLSDTTAKSIGLAPYYPYILKTFDSILRALDLQVGRSLLMTKSENANKEPEEMITGDRKPKLDLFRTCIAAIPRLIPDGMPHPELVELITRLTVHVDEELKGLAFQALQNLMLESSSWREHVIHGFVQFIQKDISDTKPALLDSTLRLLSQLLVQWKSTTSGTNQQNKDVSSAHVNIDVLHEVEGLCLVMMCSCRVVTRKLALHLLREVRNIFNIYSDEQLSISSLLEVIDKACPAVLEKLMPLLPTSEKPILLTLPTIDLAWVMDRAVTLWLPAGGGSMQDGNQINYSFHRVDMWIRCVAEFASREHAQHSCPHAVGHAWPIVFTRLNALFPLVDPSAQPEQTRASSILRSSKKGTSEKDVHMQLWQNYVILACTIAMHSAGLPQRCSSPELGVASSPESNSDKSPTVQACTAANLFQRLVPLMRCDSSDMRDTIVNGLGYCNPVVFKELGEELLPFLKEAIDKKQDSLRRRRKRDILRVQLAHIFELMAENKAFSQNESGIIELETGSLTSMFVDYIDGARQYLEGENDRDLPILQEIRLHFSAFIQHLICNTPMEYRKNLLSRDLRYSLFHLFANWSGHFNLTFGPGDKRTSKEEAWSEQEFSAVQAMSAVLCCGKVFDPNGLNDNGYIYHWLDTLLSSQDEKIYELAKETVFLLLDFNSEAQGLLDWVIDRCYTGHNEVADGCFNALAAVFQTREYPCDHVAMLNLAVLNVGSPRMSTHETAIQLLHLLDLRFFQEPPVFKETTEDLSPPVVALNDTLLAVSYCNSQIFISDQLARIHTDLTMPMFSEITQRFQTARPSVRQTLLKYLLPWLHNMELVDPSLPQTSPLTSFLTRLTDAQSDAFMPPLKGEGWGSTQATEMVLNNLFYITVTFGDEHPLEIEALWAALVACWSFNLKVIIRYLIIITNIAATDLLPYAKRVVTYLGRAKPEKLVDELMNELQTVETLNVNIERTQPPPYYRLSSIKKVSSATNAPDDEKQMSPPMDYQLEKGILHTKRHSANEDVQHESTPRTNSTASLRSINSNSTGSTAEQPDDDVIGASPRSGVELRRSESPAPRPLTMPAYGGYYAPLNECLPENFSPTPGFHRSNIAVMFLCDLVLDGMEVDWSPHLPLMLHIIFLGLDHSRALVYEHCKKLLQNLLLLAASQEQISVGTSRLLLSYRSSVADTLKVISEDRDAQLTLETPSRDPYIQYITKSTFSIDSSATVTPDSSSDYTDPDSLGTVDDVIRALLNFMESRKGRPLWSSEDITPKVLSTLSATHLGYFLKYTVKCFKELSPLALVEQRWSQVALQLALSCSSRHYAGRSFQILRALLIRPSTQMLSDILSRLVETVAEQGEDMQGYVTEMMLTLEASIDNLDLEFRPIDFMRELFMSTPNLAKDFGDTRRSAITAPKHSQAHHARSTSYTVSAYTQRAYAGGECPNCSYQARRKRFVNTLKGDGRISCTEVESRKTNLARSRSAQSLKNLDQTGTEDKLTLVTQMFWITVSLLESDYEYEFTLAVRLLDKILCHLQPERPECRDKLEKILNQIKWPNFPGVYILLIKGCTSHMAAESTWALLSKIILCVNSPVIDPSGHLGFPMVTIALLPYLVHNYENPSQVCRDAADRVAQMCGHQGDRLTNLATVMSLYSRGTFGKDSFQWTKCVVKYLLDVYASSAVSMVIFLVEVLEKGQLMYQSSCLQILYCMVHYLDIATTPSSFLNQELFQSINKHVQTNNWREALKILKLAVTRSSTLATPPPSSQTSVSDLPIFINSVHTSFADAESLTKFNKELPGRTLDFSIDLSRTPIIGRKFISSETLKQASPEEKSPATSGSAVSLSRKPSNNQDIDSVWRRPQASQARVRERLVNLLTCFGQRVGLPKSPSVIFSQSSDTLDHQPSVGGSSGEETSLPETSSNDTLMCNESSGNELMVTFKGFDFLDNELEESESEDFFSQLVDRRHSLHLETSPTTSARPNFGSEPNLAISSNISRRSPRDSVTEEPSTDEESESSEHEASGATATTDSITGSTSIQVKLGDLRSSPLTASTQSLSSNSASETDTVDLNSSQASPAFSQLSGVLLNLEADEVEEVWKSHVTKVLAESSLSHVGKTCQIFPKLFRELRKRLTTMTKEACYYICKAENLKSITSQILQVLELVHQQLDCPFLFSESDSLLGTRLVDRHRFCVLEIQECFETYSSRKDQAEQSLEGLKCSIKQQSLGDGGSYLMAGEEQLELCQKLYKLIFQLVLLFESYLKLLDMFQLVTASPQVSDMSGQVIQVRNELLLALQELENGQASPLHVDTKVVSKQEGVLQLSEYLHGGKYLKAIQILRCFRSLWPNDLFGLTIEDDVLTLLSIYCSSLAEKKTGVFALTKTSLELTPLYGQLMDINNRLSSLTSSSAGASALLLTSPFSSREGDMSGGSGDGGIRNILDEQRRLEILLKSPDSSIL
ncbi:protein furry homolog isoform X2 [Physella acuta]|uniref:protein furry homolog isoform X2 n=1 Tax=Physella acuta TaxID=109671 RepID=UPI0027DC1F41|nr:protein furry homolog isoform X2 [Physella acuta]